MKRKNPEGGGDSLAGPTPDDPTGPARALALLRQALEIAPEARSDFLDSACGADTPLRREVATLLAAEARSDFLEVSAGELATAEAGREEGEGAGARIGPYELLEEIGAGGMSRVMLAERVDGQFEQKVAVKLLHSLPGTDAEARRRFDAERRILARLAHPAISRILDGGIADSGRPYLVMEYLDAEPITEYCQRRELGMENRLRLFLDVCAAVAHAHQQLVVHRDLKPSNVLVTKDGRVKLLDFGIAKLLDPAADPGISPVTRTGLLLLTPEYAAPEQIKGEPVTTATDVYGLGLLLYELLTDSRPFDLSSRRASEIERVVCEEPPPKPSTRPVAAASSSGAPRSALRGDLDTIVLQTLRKRPAARYGSAQELAADIERYLRKEPISARPATVGYRVRRFAQRNLGSVTAAMLFVLLLMSALAVVIGEQRKTARQRDIAQLEAAKARRVTDFTLGLFEAGNPESGPDVTARELLQVGLENLDGLGDEPLVQAEILSVMSAALTRLGDHDGAVQAARREIDLRRAHEGPLGEGLATALVALGGALSVEARYEEAEPLLLEAVEIDEKAFPGIDREETVWHLRELGRHHARRQRLDLAQPVAERGLAMARRLGLDSQVTKLLGLSGYIAGGRGDFERGRQIQEEVLEIRLETEGLEHPDTAATLNNLGYYARMTGDFDKAEEYYTRALEIKRKLFPSPHRTVGATLFNLGEVHRLQGRFDEAEARLLEAREVIYAHVGERGLVSPLLYMGRLEASRGRPEVAEERLLEALETARTAFGDPGAQSARVWLELARLHQEQGRTPKADSAYRGAIAGYETASLDNPRLMEPLVELAELRSGDDSAEARALLERARELASRNRNADDPLRLKIEKTLEGFRAS